LWQAQTPQMFRYGLLRRATDGRTAVTDEAGALEALGYRPLLVRADATNFKVTYPADLELAEQIMQARNR
jgi:2-C-methyl-D-erythritol 4-phosphate cytidylyltransferase